MYVIKIINYNVDVCLDNNEHELIAFGKGIGFPAMPYELLDLSLITRTYYGVDPNYFGLVQEFDESIFEVCAVIIDYARNCIESNLNPNVVFTLADHINFAIERVSQGIEPQNALLWEIKRFYPQEFLFGIYALELIQDRLDILLPEDEAGFIALHFVNAEYGTDIRDAVKFPDQMQAIVDIVERDLGILLDESSLHYERFMTQIKFQIQRIYRKELLFSEDRELSLLMLRIYPS